MNKLTRVRANSDQANAGLRDYLPDIQRIADHGPKDDGSDLLLIRMVFFTTAGNINLKLIEINNSNES